MYSGWPFNIDYLALCPWVKGFLATFVFFSLYIFMFHFASKVHSIKYNFETHPTSPLPSSFPLYPSAQVSSREDAIRHLSGAVNKEVCGASRTVFWWGFGPQPCCWNLTGKREMDYYMLQKGKVAEWLWIGKGNLPNQCWFYFNYWCNGLMDLSNLSIHKYLYLPPVCMSTNK